MRSFNALMMLRVGGFWLFKTLLTTVRSRLTFLDHALTLPARFISDRNSETISLVSSARIIASVGGLFHFSFSAWCTQAGSRCGQRRRTRSQRQAPERFP